VDRATEALLVVTYDFEATQAFERALNARDTFLKNHADDRHAHPMDWAAWVVLDETANAMLANVLSGISVLPRHTLLVNAQFIGTFGSAALARQHGIWQASTFAPRVYLPQPFIV
jgi:hypothetical protein